MITGQKVKTVWQSIFDSVGKPIVRFAANHTGLQQIGHVTIEGNFPQAYYNPDLWQSFNLCGQMSSAVADLLWCGLVTRRGAPDN